MPRNYTISLLRVSAILVALWLVPAGARPINERFCRYEVQALALTDGLRIDLYALFGGRVAAEIWRRYDPNGDFLLTAQDRQDWGADLLAPLAISIGGERRPASAELVVIPDYQAFVTCAEPVVVRARVRGAVPRRDAAECRVAVAPALPYPLYARVSFVASRAVRLESLPAAPGAARARLSWPANQAIDTRLPPLTVPDWFAQASHELPLTPLGPGALTNQAAVRPAPPERSTAPGPRWPGLLFAAIGLVAWFGWRRSRRDRL